VTAATTLAVVLLLPLAAAPSSTESLQLSSDLRVVVLRGRDVALEVRARAGDDYATLAARVCASEGKPSALAAWNGDAAPTDGQWVRVPLPLLSHDYRSLVLRALFPDDRLDGADWIHLARRGRLPTYDEGLWQVAQWFARSARDRCRRTGS
jgi:hypothetical protein